MKPINPAILCLCLLLFTVISGCVSSPKESTVDGNEDSNEINVFVYLWGDNCANEIVLSESKTNTTAAGGAFPQY